MAARSNDRRNKPTTTFGCVQINLRRSLKAKHELLHYIQNEENPPEIVFVTEPYLGKNLTFKGPTNYHIYQVTNKKEGEAEDNTIDSEERVKAVIMVLKNTFSAIGMSKYSTTNIITIQATNVKGKHFFFTSIYIEPKTDYNHTMDRLNLLLTNTQGATHIITGDLNGRNVLWGDHLNNKRGNSIADIITLFDLKIANKDNKYTYCTTTETGIRKSAIDLTLYSQDSNTQITNWNVDDTICPSSDHTTIRFNIDLNNKLNKGTKQTTFRYDTSNIKWEAISEDIKIEINSMLPPNFVEIIKTANQEHLNALVQTVTDIIRAACDKYLPRHSPRREKALWWTDELEELKIQVIQNHHKLRKAIKQGRPVEALVTERNELREKYSNTFIKTSTEHFREFCNTQSKEDVWTITNKIIQTRPAPRPPNTLKLENGEHTKDAQDTAQTLLNTFFPDDTPDYTQTQKELREEMKVIDNNLPDVPFTQEEIIECIKTFSRKKAPGQDGLTSDICLNFANTFPEILTEIMNRCLILQYFPDCWKIAIAKIIPKPGKKDYSHISAYRPIGLINILGKTLEKLIINRINHHMYSSDNNVKNQYGFKLRTSTSHAITTALDIINRAKNKGEQVLATSLDIKSAFDNAWWPAIFLRLRQIKCPSNLYNMLLQYTQNRIVMVNYGETRAHKGMTKGCIQGSVCGPSMWNFILDLLLLTPTPEGSHLQAYADDILLITHAKDCDKLAETTNSALKLVSEWGEAYKLKFSAEKTQSVAFTNKARKCKIQLGNQQVSIGNQMKYLGIIIDNKLKFTKHALYVINKAKKIYNRIAIFVKPTWGIISENVKTIYNQVIQPIITYAAGIWAEKALKFKYVSEKLLSLQRLFAIKIIKAFKTTRTSTAICLSKLTPLTHKLQEIATIEKAKSQRTTTYAPPDILIEKPIEPRFQEHPAKRKGIDFFEINDEEEYMEFCTQHTEHWQVFTDGSRHDNTVGAAVVTINPTGKIIKDKKLKLQNYCSVFQAELLAVKTATEIINKNNDIRKAVILSDSKSVLTELLNPNTCIENAVHTLRNINIARAIHKEVKFAWVRAHIGIGGNELADISAKSAANLKKSPDYDLIPISHVKKCSREESKERTGDYFETVSPILKNHFQTYNQMVEFLNYIPCTFALTQILTGHGYCRSYLMRFKITDTDKCPCDQETIQTFDHLIQECPRFYHTRTEYIMTLPNSTDPFQLREAISKEGSRDKFIAHITHIVNELKNFNS